MFLVFLILHLIGSAHIPPIIKLFPRPWKHKSDLTDPISVENMAIAFMRWLWPQNSIFLIYWLIRWWENPPHLDNNTIRNTRYAGKNVGRTRWFPLDERKAISVTKLKNYHNCIKYNFSQYMIMLNKLWRTTWQQVSIFIWGIYATRKLRYFVDTLYIASGKFWNICKLLFIDLRLQFKIQ